MPKVLVAAVLLVLGAAIAFFALQNGDAPPAPAQPQRQQPDGPRPAPAPAAAAATPDAQAAVAAGQPSERLEVATPPPGAKDRPCRVHGRLVGRDGQPRADVELRLQTFALPDDFDEPPPPELLRNRGELPSARSDAVGRFAFEVKPGARGRLELAGDELVFGRGRSLFGPVREPLDLGDLELLGAGSIAGVVRDDRGQPVADVKVTASADAFGLGDANAANSDAAGRFRIGKLQPGTLTLRTASAKFLPATAKVELAAEQHKQDVVLELQAGKAVSGRVVDDLGRPVAGIKVGAKRTEQHPGVQMERFTPDEATETDAGGWFLLAGLSGETASIRAFGDGYTAAIANHVAVGTGNLLLRVDRAAALAGTLRDAAGQPLAGSRVRAINADRADPLHGVLDLPLGLDRNAATTAADGSFRIEHVDPGNVTVRAEGKAHRPAEQQLVLTPGQQLQGLQLVADAGATARVKVVDDAGETVAGAHVRALPKRAAVAGPGGSFRARRVEIDDSHGDVRIGGGDDPLGEATTNAAGIAELAGLPGGVATFEASHAEFAEAQPRDVAVPAAGAVDASLVLRRPCWAKVRVTGADGGEPIANARFVVHGPLGGEAARDRNGNVDAHGEARFGPLPPGDYWAELELEPKARAMGGGAFVFGGDSNRLPQTRVQFTLAPGSDVPVQLQRPLLARVHGIVTGADGPAAGVVVELTRRDGDGDGGGGLPGLEGLGGASERTGADGAFSLSDVEPGEYELVFGKPEQLVKARQPLSVPANTAELRADLRLGYGKLRLEVRGSDAPQGLAGAEVELLPTPADSGQPRQQRRVMMLSMRLDNGGGEPQATTMTMGQNRARTRADGSVEIDLVPPGSYTVRITDDAHAPRELLAQLVVENQTTDCGRVELQPAGHIAGTVVSPGGGRAGMALVSCRRIGDDQQQPRREPAMGGRFRLDGLAPGRYALRAQPMMQAGDAWGPEVEVEVQAGREPATVQVTLPKQ